MRDQPSSVSFATESSLNYSVSAALVREKKMGARSGLLCDVLEFYKTLQTSVVCPERTKSVCKDNHELVNI